GTPLVRFLARALVPRPEPAFPAGQGGTPPFSRRWPPGRLSHAPSNRRSHGMIPMILLAAWLAQPGDTAAQDYEHFGIYEMSTPRPVPPAPRATTLPLALAPGDRIALVGNTLLERAQEFGQFEALLQQRFPGRQLVVRHLAWSADAFDVQPRPANFADTE